MRFGSFISLRCFSIEDVFTGRRSIGEPVGCGYLIPFTLSCFVLVILSNSVSIGFFSNTVLSKSDPISVSSPSELTPLFTLGCTLPRTFRVILSASSVSIASVEDVNLPAERDLYLFLSSLFNFLLSLSDISLWTVVPLLRLSLSNSAGFLCCTLNWLDVLSLSLGLAVRRCIPFFCLFQCPADLWGFPKITIGLNWDKPMLGIVSI